MEKAVRMTREEIKEEALHAFEAGVKEKWNAVIGARMSNFVEKSRELERAVAEMSAILDNPTYGRVLEQRKKERNEK